MEAYREEPRGNEEIHHPFEVSVQSRQGKNVMADPHYHDYVEILYCNTGCFEAVLGDQRCLFSQGDMVLIHSQEVHRMASLGDKNNEYVVIKFDPGLLLSADQTTSELKYLLSFTLGMTAGERVFRCQELETSFIPGLVEELQQEYQQQDYGYDLAMRVGLSRLFLWVLRRWRKEKQEFATARQVSVSHAKELQKVFDHIDRCYQEPINMQTMAKMMGMGYSSFSKFFNYHTQKSFSDYLNEVRISKSKILLATSTLNITEIAMEVGFSNTSYFIHCFKTRNQVTPQQFRRKFLPAQEAAN